MSKITRDIDSYDRLMLRTSQLKECQKELASLRAWKEKARPFLEHHLKEYHQNYYDEAVELSGANSIQATTIKKCMDTLTELLKEGE